MNTNHNQELNMEENFISEHIVFRDNEPDLRFKGQVVSFVSKKTDRVQIDLCLYKTIAGKFVCESIVFRNIRGEADELTGEVCETLQDVIDFFGHGSLAKKLYAKAGIDSTLVVE